MAQRPDGAGTASGPAPQSPVVAEHDAAEHEAVAPRRLPPHLSNVTVYQTAGADAYTGPMLAAGSAQPALNPRSCVTCRRRKVRCDKQMPCSNCRRALVPCVFPAPGRAPRRLRPRDPNAPPKTSGPREVELMKRLRKLEDIVEELSSQVETESAAKASSSAASPDTAQDGRRHASGTADLLATSSPESRDADISRDQHGETITRKELHKNFGRMVLDDHRGTTRYVSGGFWSKLNDELDFIRKETRKLSDDSDSDSDYDGTPNDSPAAGLASIADHHAFVLGYRSADVSLTYFHPPSSHAVFLWSVYQQNVEPLIKVLHLPSTDLMLRDAARSYEKLSPGNEALLFAIYFAAVTSLQPDEVDAKLGAGKDRLVAQYRFALEQALAKANFLDTCDLTVIQAFTIFLVVVRRHDESRFCWSLTGLLIRIAQGMGIHRDGTHFGLSPFETEIRRRLWWAIMMLDFRSSEELGTDMALGEDAYDTQFPSNIDDADISPDSTEFPPAREGRSDCAVSIVRSEICAMSRRLVMASSVTTPLSSKVDRDIIAEKERMLAEAYQRIEDRFLQHVVDEADSLYWVAAMIVRVIMAKMCLVIYQPMLYPGSDHELSVEIRQRLFVAAIEVVEYSKKLSTDPRCIRYCWLFNTYTNWHAIAYALIEMCRRPWTPLVERGWEAVNSYDKVPAEAAKRSDQAAVFLPVRKLFARARKYRESEIARLKVNQDEAQRLDFAERMNPEPARPGPVSGLENRMEEARETWRALIRPDGGTPPTCTGRPRQPASAEVEAPAAVGAAASIGPKPQHPANPEPQVPVPMDMSIEAMQYMGELVMQPNLSITELWNVANDPAKNPGLLASASPGGGFANCSVDEAALRQQALTLQMQPPGTGQARPGPWGHALTTMNIGFDDKAMDDTDMLGHDFNWQDWSQSIRGLETEGAEPMQGW